MSSSNNKGNKLSRSHSDSSRIPLGEIGNNSEVEDDIKAKRLKKNLSSNNSDDLFLQKQDLDDSDKSSWDGPYTQSKFLARAVSEESASSDSDSISQSSARSCDNPVVNNYSDVERVIKNKKPENSGIQILKNGSDSEIIPPSGQLRDEQDVVNVLESPLPVRENKVSDVVPLIEVGSSPES